MRGEDADDRSAHARDLQPSGESGAKDLGAPVSEDDLRRLNGCHSRKTKRLQENIDRRMSDRDMLKVLARDGYQGSRYNRFEDALIRYGISVLRGWMHSGFIFQLVADRGFGLHPHERELEELASNSDLREELAMMTVALALPRFKQRALIEGGWTFEGGASITTYFMGSCAYDFPNEFRRYRAGEERHRRALQREHELYEDPAGSLLVETEVLGTMDVVRHLKDIKDPRTRAVVALRVDDHTHEDIRESLDETSVRVIEGLLYRWRTKEKQSRERGKGDPHGQPGR